MSDTGACLSMHQPWASLLVYGIKRIEDRGWPTEHRGRLWIGSTAKQPTSEGIEEMEAFYSGVHACEGQAAIEFPPAYPTGVLLGCVDVVDCLLAEQVEAWDGLPEGLKAEVGSPYCFLCQASQRLVVPQQMRGNRRIFKLEKKLHKVAQLGLKPAPNSQALDWAAFGAAPAANAELPPSQSKNKYQELQKKMDAARGGTGDTLQPHSASGGSAEEGSGHSAAVEGESCLASNAATVAAAAAAATALAGLPRAVALQQQQQQASQQDPQRRLRAVQKKLRQIAALEERQRGNGAIPLQPEEAAKLAQRRQLVAEEAALQAEVGPND